jgi:hypothetical protein
MISNGEIKSAATAASAVAIAAFGSGVPKSHAAMIIVVPATTSRRQELFCALPISFLDQSPLAVTPAMENDLRRIGIFTGRTMNLGRQRYV